MKFFVGYLVLLVAAGAALGDAKSDFDELFGDTVRKVSASRDSARGVALAKQMFDIAETLEVNAELKVLLWTHAVRFSEKTPSGYDTAVKAISSRVSLLMSFSRSFFFRSPKP